MPGEYVVQKIVGKRIKNGNEIEYKVKWKGYDSKQNTWQPLKHLKNVNSMIKEFEERNKHKLQQISTTLHEENKIKTNSLPKKALKNNGIKKMLNTAKLNNEVEKQRERQSMRIINRQRKEIDTIPQKSQSLNRKDAKSESKEIPQTVDQSLKVDQLNQTSEVLELGINWDNLANKIITVTQQKQKLTYEITGIAKAPGQADLFLVQDSLGQQSQRTREYVLRNLSLELIAYYQKQIRSND